MAVRIWLGQPTTTKQRRYLLLALSDVAPKLRITFPVGGEMLTTDALVQAESNLAITVCQASRSTPKFAPSKQSRSSTFDWPGGTKMPEMDGASPYTLLTSTAPSSIALWRWEPTSKGRSSEQRRVVHCRAFRLAHLWVNSSDVAITRGQAVINCWPAPPKGSRGWTCS
jgi:hypothetical protein